MTALSAILSRYTTIPADLRAQLSVELAGMERDAGRYKWLRNNSYGDHQTGYHFRTPPCLPDRGLDAAIDAAMTKGK